MVFALPFNTARFFRPTLLDVFGFSNTQLGDLFAVYGVLAMLSYLPGGMLADHFSARFLLSASLVATALGGFAMALIPGPLVMGLIYAYWGVTSIFLFWGALIRATRDWGGSEAQGMAFGILEAGRGFVAATVAALLVFVFAAMLPDDASAITDAGRRAALQMVIVLYSLVTLAAGVLTWVAIPDTERVDGPRFNPLQGMFVVVGRPVVWAQAAIVVAAYCGYKGLDNYALYATQVLGMTEVAAAQFATWGAYLRPVAAILAGLFADRFNAAKAIGLAFLIMLLSYLPLSMLAPGTGARNIILINLFVSFFAVFALRGVYFALLEENRTPKQLTGAAVGMVSLVGFTPEIFFAPVTGRILDATPGIGGHQHYFLFLTAVAALGLLAVLLLLVLHRRGAASFWPARKNVSG